MPPEQRPVGFVFQDYALFPHLTVAPTSASPAPRGRRALERFGIEHLADARPAALGRRAAARRARAGARARPRVLLLDEPLAALDAHTQATARRAAGSSRARPPDAPRHPRLRGRGRAGAGRRARDGRMRQTRRRRSSSRGPTRPSSRPSPGRTCSTATPHRSNGVDARPARPTARSSRPRMPVTARSSWPSIPGTSRSRPLHRMIRR